MRHEDWIARRDETVWGTHGLATLAATEWLDTTPRRLDSVAGVWHADGASAIGVVDGGTVVLSRDESIRQGDLLIRCFARDGAVAIRVLDPAFPAARGISRIERYDHDPRLLSAARIVDTSTASTPTESVDGHRSETSYDTVLELDVAGERVRLATQTQDDGSLFAAFSDATSGAESYRFRFLRIPGPHGDTVEVDLNRAYLPPCAFSDHYVCVFPPAQNRWPVAVRGGERAVS